MKLKLYTTALLSLLLVSQGLQAQTTSATPPDVSKHASSTNYTEGHIYYVKQLPSGQYTGTMFDKEGNEYPVATFSSLKVWWTTWNMRSKTYSDGTRINGGVPSAGSALIAQFCYPSSTSAITKTAYWDKSQGLLYNYRAVVNKDNVNGAEGGIVHEVRQGICPTGWHVPSDAELTTLTASMGSDAVAGTAMKSLTRLAGSVIDPTGMSASADMGGFNLLLAGRATNGQAEEHGLSAHLWSSSASGGSDGWNRYVANSNASATPVSNQSRLPALCPLHEKLSIRISCMLEKHQQLF